MCYPNYSHGLSLARKKRQIGHQVDMSVANRKVGWRVKGPNREDFAISLSEQV
jgi:hypothetical protein